jgi:hypothetical protein
MTAYFPGLVFHIKPHQKKYSKIISFSILIDWCLRPTFAVFQPYCGVNKCLFDFDENFNHQKQN